MQQFSQLISYHHDNQFNVFGFVDGVSFAIEEDSDPVQQNAYYNGWKGGCVISNIFVYSADGCCIWARVNCPGSWHDAHVAREFTHLMTSVPDPYCVVADTGFPSHGRVKNKIRTPAKSNQHLSRDQIIYSNQITSMRQACEWGMRAIEGGFERLKTTLPVNKEKRLKILVSVVHLYNIRTRWTGVNQVRTVYDPRWKPCTAYTSNNRNIARYYRIIS